MLKLLATLNYQEAIANVSLTDHEESVYLFFD